MHANNTLSENYVQGQLYLHVVDILIYVLIELASNCSCGSYSLLINHIINYVAS